MEWGRGGKIKHEVLGEWENFCCIDRNEGVRRDPLCGEVRGGLGETFMRQTFIVVLGKAPGSSEGSPGEKCRLEGELYTVDHNYCC